MNKKSNLKKKVATIFGLAVAAITGNSLNATAQELEVDLPLEGTHLTTDAIKAKPMPVLKIKMIVNLLQVIDRIALIVPIVLTLLIVLTHLIIRVDNYG